MLEKRKILGREVWLAAPDGLPGRVPLLCMVAEDDFPAQYEGMRALLDPAIAAGTLRPHAVAAFVCEDWNRDFSPWPAPALFKKAEPFAGGAPRTLAWLLQAVGALEEALPVTSERYLLGYSLAGLFALWTMFQTDQFAGYASCSGSLWFDGWQAYAESNTPKGARRLYMSLGDRESRSRNPRMAAVGEATEATQARLRREKAIADMTFVWETGGHFDGVPQRQARGAAWLLRPYAGD